MNSTNSTTDLVKDNSIDGIDATLPTLTSSTSDTSSTNFPVNHWGQKTVSNVLNDTVFKPFIPGTLISQSDTPVNTDTSTITFAAKVDYEKPAGLYELGLNFSAIPIVTNYYMQDIAASSTLANQVCTEEPTVVLDKRDEQAYTIRRINGTCWMVENLQFTGMPGDPEGIMTLDAATSNVASNTTLNYSNIGGSFNDAKIYRDTITVQQETPIEGPSETATMTIDAVWYNYAAASAGTITGESNTDPQIYDICPSGWRLPSLAEQTALLNNIGPDPRAYAPIMGGYYREDGAHVGTMGLWWASNAGTAANRYRIVYDGTALTNILNYTREYGMYVRCVMGDTNINNLTYMQDFAKLDSTKKSQVINLMVTNQNYNLTDSRDTQIYSVKKLEDGNVWMTRNLAIGCNGSGSTYGTAMSSKTLTSTDSDVLNSWDTPTKAISSYGNSNADGYTSPYMNCGTPGAWYTYAAATAGTIVGQSNSYEAEHSVCPLGWRLPSEGEQTSALSNIPALELSVGGYYNNTTLNATTTNGVYWSSTTQSDTRRYYIIRSGGTAASVNHSLRAYGYFIRCVAR